MILIGWHATSGKAWAIRTGLIHAAALMTINTINVLGLYRFGIERITPEADPVSMSLGLTLFYLAVAFISAVYAIANISPGGKPAIILSQLAVTGLACHVVPRLGCLFWRQGVFPQQDSSRGASCTGT